MSQAVARSAGGKSSGAPTAVRRAIRGAANSVVTSAQLPGRLIKSQPDALQDIAPPCCACTMGQPLQQSSTLRSRTRALLASLTGPARPARHIPCDGRGSLTSQRPQCACTLAVSTPAWACHACTADGMLAAWGCASQRFTLAAPCLHRKKQAPHQSVRGSRTGHGRCPAPPVAAHRHSGLSCRASPALRHRWRQPGNSVPAG